MKAVIGMAGSPQNVKCEVLQIIGGVADVQVTRQPHLRRAFFLTARPGARVWIAQDTGGLTERTRLSVIFEGRVVIGDPEDGVLQAEEC